MSCAFPISLLFCLFCMACMAVPEENRPDLPSTLVGEWTVERIGEMSAEGASRAYIAFDAEGQLSGNTGVNRITGTWTADGESLLFSQLISTRMAGPPQLMSQERRFLDALGKVERARLEDENLLVLVSVQGPMSTSVVDEMTLRRVESKSPASAP